MSHTLTPWKVSDSHGLCIIGPEGVIADMGDDLIAAEPDEARANGDLIVRAINSHEPLVEALIHCHDWILAQQRDGTPGEAIRLEARAALAAAGETKGT